MVLFQDAVINTGPVDSARELKHVPSFTPTINSLGVRVNTSEMLVQGSCHIGNSTGYFKCVPNSRAGYFKCVPNSRAGYFNFIFLYSWFYFRMQ